MAELARSATKKRGIFPFHTGVCTGCRLDRTHSTISGHFFHLSISPSLCAERPQQKNGDTSHVEKDMTDTLFVSFTDELNNAFTRWQKGYSMLLNLIPTCAFAQKWATTTPAERR